ncbi:MAG: glycosyltransferase family 4 protein [Phycisphaerales bacterium]|nr:glycosyltransferase family 4 protein [Phycisphaerales bacterium]
MRITFILPAVSMAGGIRVVANHAKELAKRGHRVVVVSMPPRQLTWQRKVKSLLRGRGWPSVEREESYLDGMDVEQRELESWRFVEDADLPEADVVVATWWETAAGVAALSRSRGAKAILIQGYEVFRDFEPSGRDAVWKLPLHKIVVSRWLESISRDRFDDDQASLVPNAVDAAQFHAAVRGKQRRPTVGLVYNPEHCKGADIALEAFRLALRQMPELKLVAFGRTSPVPEMPLPSQARYVRDPAQAMLCELYGSCDAWLFSSRSEGFGLPILEAMACRTPVIGTRAGAAPELLSDGGGILINTEDPNAMAQAIVQISRMSETTWQVMSDAAYATATHYTWADATTLFEQALQTAIERDHRSESAHESAAETMVAT